MKLNKLLAVAAIAVVSTTNSFAADAPYSTNWGTLTNLSFGPYDQGYAMGSAGSFDATYQFTLASATDFLVEVNPFWGISVTSAMLTSGANNTVLSWSGANSDYRAYSSGLAGTQFSLHVTGTGVGTGNSFNNVVTAVPEPETFAMLLAGLGLVGMVARRRNKGSTA